MISTFGWSVEISAENRQISPPGGDPIRHIHAEYGWFLRVYAEAAVPTHKSTHTFGPENRQTSYGLVGTHTPSNPQTAV